MVPGAGRGSGVRRHQQCRLAARPGRLRRGPGVPGTRPGTVRATRRGVRVVRRCGVVVGTVPARRRRLRPSVLHVLRGHRSLVARSARRVAIPLRPGFDRPARARSQQPGGIGPVPALRGAQPFSHVGTQCAVVHARRRVVCLPPRHRRDLRARRRATCRAPGAPFPRTGQTATRAPTPVSSSCCRRRSRPAGVSTPRLPTGRTSLRAGGNRGESGGLQRPLGDPRRWRTARRGYGCGTRPAPRRRAPREPPVRCSRRVGTSRVRPHRVPASSDSARHPRVPRDE